MKQNFEPLIFQLLKNTYNLFFLIKKQIYDFTFDTNITVKYIHKLLITEHILYALHRKNILFCNYIIKEIS